MHEHLHRLHGFRLKINQAEMHVRRLGSEIDAWFAGRPYGVFGEYDSGPPERYVFKVRFLDPVPPTWAITLGDFAHNARSALDHLAYVVVLANNGGQDAWTQFPIVLRASDWKEQSKRGIGNASQRHKDIIESFQPYHREDLLGNESEWGAIEDPLAVLQGLSNVDKHRVLNATPAVIRSIGYDVHPVRDIESVGASKVNHGPLLDGEEFVSVQIVSNGPEPELTLERHENIEIQVQNRVNIGADSYTLHNVTLTESLDAILKRLNEIFEVFVSEFR